MTKDHIPLSRAAFELGRTYHQTLKLLMTRELDGENRNGKWLVTVESVQRAKRQAAHTAEQVA